MVKCNRGRKKIEIKKLANKSHLQVTFSKRRFGLFKKASELCTLCGAQILMLVFSPGKKVFSFGHPSVKDLIDRLFNRIHNYVIPHHQNNNLQLVETPPTTNIQYLNGILTQELANQEKERYRKEMLDKMRHDKEQRGTWYEKDVKELNLNETDHLICALQDLKNKLVSEMFQDSQVNVSQNYLGENSGFVGGHNVDVGTDLFDQRRNTFNYNPNMDFTNHTPLSGYNNDGVMVPTYNNDGVIQPSSNMNYDSSFNFNQS